jgi:PAS domain-containing protein
MTIGVRLPSLAGLGVRRLSEAVIVADVDSGRMVLWNPAAERMFGYSAVGAADVPFEALAPNYLTAGHSAGPGGCRVGGRARLIAAGGLLQVSALRRVVGDIIPQG